MRKTLNQGQFDNKEEQSQKTDINRLQDLPQIYNQDSVVSSKRIEK